MSKAVIARKIDDLGRIVIPMELRRELEWHERGWVDITPFGQYILLQAHGSEKRFPADAGQDNPIYQDIVLGLQTLKDDDLLWILKLVQRLGESEALP